MAAGFALFDTALGRCGIAWRGQAVVAVQLPEEQDALTRARLAELVPDGLERVPRGPVARAVRLLQSHFAGEAADLQSIALDLEAVPPFHRRVYDLARRIPRGQTLTYGQLASRLGVAGAARAVGQALRRNPFAVVVPCHRILAAAGAGGFTAPGGLDTKRRLLALEGSELEAGALFAGSRALSFDPAEAVAHLCAADRRLARWVRRVGPLALKLHATPSLFTALAEAIVYQQLNARAAAAIWGRVQALFPRRDPTPEKLLRLPQAKLLGAGLSNAKLLALRDLAERTVGGQLPSLTELESLSDAEAIERLTVVRGVGRWTVQMLLIFRLGRPDVFPVDDYGIRKGYARVYDTPELPSPRTLESWGERWRPYRTVASWYLWRALEVDVLSRSAALNPRAESAR